MTVGTTFYRDAEWMRPVHDLYMIVQLSSVINAHYSVQSGIGPDVAGI